MACRWPKAGRGGLVELDDARAPVELLVAEELGHELLLGEDDGKAAEEVELRRGCARGREASGASSCSIQPRGGRAGTRWVREAFVAGFAGGVEETKAGRTRQQRRQRRARPWP